MYPLFLEYAWLWNKYREPTVVIVLNRDLDTISTIITRNFPDLKVVYPPGGILIKIIHYLFRKRTQQFFYSHIYPKLVPFYLNSTSLYVPPLSPSFRMEYCQQTDDDFKLYSSQFPKPFLQAYIGNRISYPLNRERNYDYIRLKCNDHREINSFEKEIKNLKKTLKFDNLFVVININTKQYPYPASLRTVKNGQLYNSLIDLLIASGYYVVIQGREEQVIFKSRPRLINYAHSNSTSILNDYALYANASFVISSKSGPESIALNCDKPLLGLNYSEFSISTFNKKHRYFFKRVLDKNGNILNWKELLRSPIFFHAGFLEFEKGCSFLDMTEEDLVEAGKEFMTLFQKNDWSLTPFQQEFRGSLTPLHMDLYRIPGVPCQSYLISSDRI